MRVLIIGTRRDREAARSQGYQFGGHFVATFCRLLPSTPLASKAVPLQIVGDIIPPKGVADSQQTLAEAAAGPFNVPTYPDTTLTLELLKAKIQEVYGNH
jgi:hypothetical protein